MTRHEFLAELHRLLRPVTYLEVGVQHGWSLQLAAGSATAIGIDPAPQLTVDVGNARIFRLTSNNFFAGRAQDLLWNQNQRNRPPVDLAFIDGLHLHEQALLDFANIERHVHPAGVVVVDDVLPRTQAMAARTQCPGDWTGDVWRIEPTLRRWRPDLHLTLVDTQPTGLLLVRDLDPASRTLWHRIASTATVEHPPVDVPVPEHVLNRTAAVAPERALADLSDWRQTR